MLLHQKHNIEESQNDLLETLFTWTQFLVEIILASWQKFDGHIGRNILSNVSSALVHSVSASMLPDNSG